jgi:uncharacterized protein (DUF3820 family)
MRMSFGKYKGRELCDIPLDYLRWVLRNCDRMNAFLRGAIQAEVQRRRNLQAPTRTGR